MNKTFRIILAFAFFAAIVAIGLNGTAWANKLQAGQNAFAPAPMAAGARPQGTVIGTPSVPVGATACDPDATYCVLSDQTGLTEQSLTALPGGLTPLPAGYTVVPTRILQITGTGTSTTAPVSFTMTPALVSPQIVAYWNGTAWVQLTAAADGKYTIPAGAPLPLTVAVFTK